MRFDGSTLVVRIPMRFQRRSGRKRIVAPDGSEIVPTSKPQPDGTLIRRSRGRGAGSECWRAASTGRLQSWPLRNGSAGHTSAVSCASPCSPPISSNGSSTGGRRQGLAQLLKPFPVDWGRQRDQLR
jgi:hypothetical protein